MYGKRNYGIDIFRIMCCTGVLCYHVMDDLPKTFSIGWGGYAKIIYFGVSFCVPGFFILSGYLYRDKTELSISYIERKIINIMLKLFGWIVFWAAVHYIKTEEIYDLWENFVAGAAGKGILPVSWFLFTYCFLMIAGYPLYYFCRKYPVVFCSIVILWMIILALGGAYIGNTLPQSLWLHLYMGYFCLGMVCNEIEKKFVLNIKSKIIFLLCINISVLATYIGKVINSEEFLLPDRYYGMWFYTIWIVSLFLIVLQVPVKSKKVCQAIEILASNTFVVYLGHLPIVSFITAFFPIKRTLAAIIFIIIIFLFLEIMAILFKKLPLFRKLV